MAGTKNNDKLVFHLKRIFLYAPQDGNSTEVDEYEGRVDSFVKYLRKQEYEISRRSIYGYIEGSQHMPPDFMIPLRDWSLDINVTAAIEFCNAYEMRMPESKRSKIHDQVKKREEEIAKLKREILDLEDTIKS